jgi:acyl-coenzyme A thioesterase 13
MSTFLAFSPTRKCRRADFTRRASMASSARPFAGGSPEAARAFLETLLSSESFDRTALEGLRDARFSDGRCRCAFPVGSEKTNRYGTLHGGCIATLVDVVSTAALVTQSDHPGVSVNIDVAYMSPGPAGEEVQVDATVVKVGANLAFMEVLITSADGKVVARGSHTKYLPRTNKSKQTRRAKL